MRQKCPCHGACPMTVENCDACKKEYYEQMREGLESDD